MLSRTAIQQAVAQARAHQSAGRLDAAQTIYQNLLTSDPQNPDLLHLLALVFRQKGDNTTAAQHLRTAIKKKPTNPEAYFNLANALADLNQVDDAIKAYQKSLDQGLRFAPAHSNLAAMLLRAGRFEEAALQYRQAIHLDPSPLINHLNLGIALRELRQYPQAITALQNAIKIAPNSADAHANLAACLSANGKPNEAAAAFGRAFMLSPDSLPAHDNFSVALRLIGRFDEAIDISQKAVQQFPDQPTAHLNLAHAYAEKNEWDLAQNAFRTALSLNPNLPHAYTGLANALVHQGKKQEAILVLQNAAQHLPATESFAFQLAALGVGDTPDAPPESYVVNLFNEYAPNFDQHLVGSLKYAGHQLLYDAVIAAHPTTPMDILDLGCGTGLCGVLFKPLARQLIGIDLAPKMVEQTRARNLYTQVHQGDITPYLQTHTNDLDLILAADVFIYVGSLDALLPAAANALRPGGRLAFTIESLDATPAPPHSATPHSPTASFAHTPTTPNIDASPNFILQVTRRYAHSLQYIQKLATTTGLQIQSLQDATLRLEHNAPLPGKVVLLQKPLASPQQN